MNSIYRSIAMMLAPFVFLFMPVILTVITLLMLLDGIVKRAIELVKRA